MPTRSRHPRGHVTGARAVPIVAGVALLALGLAGCARPRTDDGPAGQPPRLHLVTGSDTLGRDAAPAGLGYPGFGGYVLVGSLPDEPTRAAVRVWASGPATAADVRRLAGALGVTGTPARHPNGWVVTGASGVLRVRDGGGHQWAYTRADRAGCPPTSVDVDNPDGASAVGCGVAMPAGPAGPTGPTASATRALAAPLLAALGLAASDVRAARVYVGSPDSTLSVSPTLDGMPTRGLEVSVNVDRTGIIAAGGRQDLPAVGAVYPLLTATQAFEELANGPRPLMEPYCGPMPDDPGSVPGSAAPPVPCPSPAPVRVTGARIGLLLTYETTRAASTPIMVPAWFFTVDGDTDAPAVIAIDPAFLAPTDQLHRPGNPVDGGPGGGGPVDGGPGVAPGGGTGGSVGPNTPATPAAPKT